MPNVIVSGEIVFATLPQLPPRAAAHVRLLDTSYADRPAIVVAEQFLQQIADAANRGEALPFELSVEQTLSDRSRYTLSAHVSQDGTDSIKPGDYINTQSYPVLMVEPSDRVIVRVEQIH